MLSRGFGRFRLYTSLRLCELIRSWRGVYVCKSRCTRTRFQFQKPRPGEHSSEHFCCVRTHFQAFMNQAEIFSDFGLPKSVRKHFRRHFRKCSNFYFNFFCIKNNNNFGDRQGRSSRSTRRSRSTGWRPLLYRYTHTHTHTHTHIHTHTQPTPHIQEYTPMVVSPVCPLKAMSVCVCVCVCVRACVCVHRRGGLVGGGGVAGVCVGCGG